MIPGDQPDQPEYTLLVALVLLPALAMFMTHCLPSTFMRLTRIKKSLAKWRVICAESAPAQPVL